jgi:ABC-type multidrug transport system fused ATPase/permease subunit
LTSRIITGCGTPIVAGWNERSQDKITLVVVMMIAAFGVLLRTRNRAFDALEAQSRAQVGSIDEAREMIARLADEMSEIQLDLSFGVEAYIDSVLVPDPFMQRFRSSLHDLVGVDTALANTSRMVERLGAVIQSRSAVLATATQEVRERQDRLLTVFFALVSILAIPPTLLLAFFGVSSNDVDSRLSLFDVHRYWPAYVLAWVPFTTLLVVGLLLRRRVRARGSQLTGFS